MNEPDWKELERLWQSAEEAAPVIDTIAKELRRRRLSQFVFVSELVLVALGAALAIWVMTLDGTLAPILGAATLLFTLFAGAASLWARRPAPVTADDSVAGALDAAIHRARTSVRWALASLWVVVACLLYLAAVVLIWALGAELPAEHTRHPLLAVAFGCAWAAGGQAFAIVYYLRRTRELARLEEIKRSLNVA